MPRLLLILLAGLLLVLAACGDDGDDDATPTTAADDVEVTATTPPETDAETPTTEAEATATDEPTVADEATATEESDATATAETDPTAEATSPAGEELPDTPVGNQILWMLATLNGEETLTEELYNEHFSESFITQIPFAAFKPTIAQLQQTYGALTFTGFAEPPTETQAVASVMTGTGEELYLIIAVTPAEPYQIDFMQLVPAEALDTTPVELADWDDFNAQLEALAAQVNFQAVELGEGDAPQPVHELNPEQRLAVGSTFKLYILGELARQVEAGELSWDDELAIREEWKSLPTGTMQDEPEGAVFPLRHYAEQMISISDNTATDHLLFHLGREQVEAMQAEMGHGEPEVNVPLLATREMFALKLAADPELVERFLAASDEEQRQILADEVAQLQITQEDGLTWTSPRAIDTIEWFASPADLVQAMASLREMAQRPGLEPIMDILAINPGIQFDPATWTYAGFKGGSEPGVLNFTWLLERADGRWFVMSVSLNDDASLIDELTVIRLMGGAAQLLAETP